MSEKIEVAVDEQNIGDRIDKALADKLDGVSRSAVTRLINDGNVTVNGNIVSKNYKCKKNDVICAVVTEEKPFEIKAEDIPLNIVYEDDDLLVVDKQKGMVVHPAAGNFDGTLVNALLFYYGENLSRINGEIRPGIVHRIDKDTSGLLIVAKNDEAHISLAQQIKDHSFHRAYQAVVYGNIKEDSGTVHQPIGRNPNDRKKMAVTDKNSKDAVTHYEVLNRFGDFTHIRCILETGRTHQIRVHMSYIGHPLAGDAVYGPKKVIKNLDGQCLHAGEIGFVHPKTGEYLEFTSPLPEYFNKFLAKLESSKR